MARARLWILMALAALLPLGLARGQTQEPLPVRNVAYVPDGHPKQVLDVFRPSQSEGRFPVVLVIPGGGPPRGGDKAALSMIGGFMQQQGYAGVVMSYRGALLTEFRDAFCALAWVYANAETYRFDTTRIAVFGHSNGGWLAAMLGVVDDPSAFLEGCPHSLPADYQIDGVVTFGGFIAYPEGVFPAEAWAAAVAREARLNAAEVAAAFTAAAELPPDAWAEQIPEDLMPFARLMPAYWIDGSEPPFLLLHGDSDTTVPILFSEHFARTLEAAGVSGRLQVVTRTGHNLPVGWRSSQTFGQPLRAFLEDVFGLREGDV